MGNSDFIPHAPPLRLLIADGHAAFREGLRQFVELLGAPTVVGVAENAEQALAALYDDSFDVLLLDLALPGARHGELLVRIRARERAPPVLVLSMYNEPLIAQSALRAGATGYLTKDRVTEQLLVAILQVARGERYIDPLLAARVRLD